jgi:hypothetical protein
MKIHYVLTNDVTATAAERILVDDAKAKTLAAGTAMAISTIAGQGPTGRGPLLAQEVPANAIAAELESANLKPAQGLIRFNEPGMNLAGAQQVPGTLITNPGRMLAAPTLEATVQSSYQNFVNQAWIRTVQRFNAGEFRIPAGQNVWTALGREVDRIARNDMRASFPESQSLLINRWLKDPSGSGAYRIPDVRLIQPNGQIIFDATLGTKTGATQQVQDNILFSGGGRVIVIQPQVGPGFGQ